MRIRQILWGLLLVVACGAASAVPAQPTNAAALVEPFLLRSGKLKIAGEVHRIGPRKCTALILVGGSSIRTRADTTQAVPIFLEPQTAVVVMDRRGNGLSTGRFEVPDTANTHWQIPGFGADVAAVARHLKRQGYRRVVLAGTSMGGWIVASAAATAPKDIDAVVSMVGGASTVGISDEYDRLVATGLSLDEAAGRAQSYRGPQGYEPHDDLARARQPFLWVFGAKDASNPSMMDLAEVQKLAQSGKAFRWLLLPNADHELVDASTHELDTTWIEPVRDFIRGPDAIEGCP